MNTNGNDWWWRRQGPLLYLGLAIWYSLLITEIIMIMTVMMMTTIRSTSGYDFFLCIKLSSKYNMLCWHQMSNIVFHRILLQLPCSVSPLLDQVIMIMRWWWMMILCAVHLCTCVYLCMRLYLCVCECVFVIFTLLSHTEVKSHMSQDRSGSCIVVQGIYLKRATSIQESTQKIR